MSKRRARSVAANFDDSDGFYGGINSKNAKPGQIISIDRVGPITPKSTGGYSLMWLVYQWVFFSKTKRASIVVEIVRLFIADLKFSDKELKILRSVAEEISNSSEVQVFLEEHGIKHQFSVPYEHYQNRVERLIQHNVRGISSWMYSQKWLPANYWEYAAKHFVRVSRFVPTKKTAPSTPSHAGDLDLSVKFLFSFGDFVAFRIPDARKRWKFDLRRDLGIYLGDADDTMRGSLTVYIYPPTGSVQVRLDCMKLELSDQMLHSYMIFA